ncbi:MAG: helix-turn-helix domain-containing protein [archaeon]
MGKEQLYDLLKIGLTEGEAKVYLSLTELGSSTVGPIVKKASVAYSNIYDILNRLIEKGLVSFIIKNKTKYFQAASPSNLIEYLDKKESEIVKQKSELKKVMKELEKLRESKSQGEAEIFVGLKGLRTAYEKLWPEFRKDKDENLYFYIHDKDYGEKADLFYFSIIKILKKIKSRGIGDEQSRKSVFIKKFKNKKFAKVRYVDFPVPGNIEIFRDKMLIISWREPIIGVLVTSPSIAENFKQYFESVWKIAKK